MGEKVIITEDRNSKIFNTPIELSLRCLFILSKFKEGNISVDKLIYFDYFLIHSSDVIKKSKSIHPKYPFRSTEIIIKREILNKALSLLISKELIKVVLSEGINYTITEIGIQVLKYFESSYSLRLNQLSQLIYDTFKDYAEQQLAELVNANLQKWGSEFSKESKFRGMQ